MAQVLRRSKVCKDVRSKFRNGKTQDHEERNYLRVQSYKK